MSLIATMTLVGNLGVVKQDGAKDRLASTIEDMKVQTNVMVNVIKGDEVKPKAYPAIIMAHLKDRGVLQDSATAKADNTTVADVMGNDEKPGEATVAPSKGATDALENEFSS